MAIASQQLGIDEIVAAIQNGNVNLPTGVLYGSHRAFTVEATGQLNSAKEYQPLIVSYRNGSPVRLNEIAHVFDSVEDDKVAAWYCNSVAQQRSIILAVQRQPGHKYC